MASLLRLIPQDGTRDQARPLKWVLQMSLSSFDFQSATNPCPLYLQEMIASVLPYFHETLHEKVWYGLVANVFMTHHF